MMGTTARPTHAVGETTRDNPQVFHSMTWNSLRRQSMDTDRNRALGRFRQWMREWAACRGRGFVA